MTLDQLIKELNDIKKKKGGNVEVFYADHEAVTSIIDVTYGTFPVGVYIS